VYHNEKYGFGALSRYEDVEPALKDFETYSSARGITLDMYLADPDPNQIPVIIMMDPPEHTVMRKLVNKVFTPRAVQALEPSAEDSRFALRVDQNLRVRHGLTERVERGPDARRRSRKRNLPPRRLARVTPQVRPCRSPGFDCTPE
jgi:hypothetical protein